MPFRACQAEREAKKGGKKAADAAGAADGDEMELIPVGEPSLNDMAAIVAEAGAMKCAAGYRSPDLWRASQPG